MGFPILSVILFLPLLGALGAALLPRTAAWGWAMLTALVGLALTLYALSQFSMQTSGFQFAERQPWLPQIGVSYSLGVDGVNVFLLILNALLTVVALAASWRRAQTDERPRQFLALMMLLSFGMQGVFLATNLFLFYVFWELMLVPAYLLVGMFGGPRRTYAAIKFVLYTAVGSLLMLVGIIALGAVVSARAGIGYTLDFEALLRAGVTTLPQDTQVWLFLAFFSAFAIKSGLFPLHSWVPDTYGEAPTPVVVLLAGVMAKTGAYGVARFCLTLFPSAANSTVGRVVATLAVIGILYFALQALVAQDFRRLLGYVSISHMGVILLGLFALNAQGVEGGIVQMVNHGVIIAALFLIADYIEQRTGSRRLADFGGLALRLPWLATVFLIAALAALGLPGLNSFAGEFLAFLGAFRYDTTLGVLATIVTIPAAWYMLRFFQGVMEGPQPENSPVTAALTVDDGARPGRRARDRGRRARAGGAGVADLRWGEFATLLPLLALIVYLGLAPGLLTARIEPSVQPLIPGGAHVGQSAPAPTTVPVTYSTHGK